MTNNEWERHRDEIERCYINKGMKLSELIAYMSTKGFSKTKSQYERQFIKWGLRKNQTLPRKIDWKVVGKKVDKRKREYGKDSELIIDNELYPPEKLKKTLYGKAYVSTGDRFVNGGAPSPSTPEGIVVRTPASPTLLHGFDPLTGFMHLTWSLSLPWLRFCRMMQPDIEQESALLVPASQPSWSLAISTQPSTVKAEIMRRLTWVVPWVNLPHPLDVDIGSRISSTLSILMPEEYEGQHEALVVNPIILELYLLSNNMELHETSQRSEASLVSRDIRVIGMFRSLGLQRMKQFTKLLWRKAPTIEAIAEKLFGSAVRLFDATVVKMLLEANMNPNHLVETAEGRATPLAWAAHATHNKSLIIMNALLKHGADVNKLYRGQPAMFAAIRGNNSGAVRLLLRHSSVVPLTCIAEAASIVDLDLLKELLSSCTDVIGFYQESIHESDWRNSHHFERTLSHTGYTTILGAAAKSGRLEVIDLILQTYPAVINPSSVDTPQPYLSPLELATSLRHTKCIEPLILAGVSLNVTSNDELLYPVVERALWDHNFEAAETLIQHGARLDPPVSEQKPFTSALFEAILIDYNQTAWKLGHGSRIDQIQLVGQLIKRGARLNDEYTQSPGALLGAAIKKGDPSIISLLLDAGATTLGSKFNCIGSRAAAQCLHERGILKGILRMCGTQILANAMFEGDLDLARWLLQSSILGPIMREDLAKNTEPLILSAAAASGDVLLVQSLLDYGARVTDIWLAETLYHIEHGRGTSLVLKHLLGHFHGNGPSAVAFAGFIDRTDLLQLILSADASPLGEPSQPSHGWQRRHPDCRGNARFVVDCSVFKPQSALELAVDGRSKSCVDILIQSYAWDPLLVGRALALAIYLCEGELIESLYKLDLDADAEVTGYRELLLWYVDAEVHDDQLWTYTPLQAAAVQQNVSLARKLLEVKGANVNAPATGTRSRTALQHAVENGNLELMELLLNNAADVNGAPACNGGATALQLAATKGYQGLARKLIDLGAGVNAPGASKEGRTALEGAAEHGRIDMAHMLLEEGASVLDDGGGAQYQNAIALAEDHGHNAVSSLIKQSYPSYEGQSAVPGPSHGLQFAGKGTVIELPDRSATYREIGDSTAPEEWEHLIEWSPS